MTNPKSVRSPKQRRAINRYKSRFKFIGTRNQSAVDYNAFFAERKIKV